LRRRSNGVDRPGWAAVSEARSHRGRAAGAIALIATAVVSEPAVSAAIHAPTFILLFSSDFTPAARQGFSALPADLQAHGARSVGLPETRGPQQVRATLRSTASAGGTGQKNAPLRAVDSHAFLA